MPVGGEDVSKQVALVGQRRSFDFPTKDHLQLGEELDLIDFETGGVVGAAVVLLQQQQLLPLLLLCAVCLRADGSSCCGSRLLQTAKRITLEANYAGSAWDMPLSGQCLLPCCLPPPAGQRHQVLLPAQRGGAAGAGAGQLHHAEGGRLVVGVEMGAITCWLCVQLPLPAAHVLQGAASPLCSWRTLWALQYP